MTSMTKKDFELIAAVISNIGTPYTPSEDCLPYPEYAARQGIAEHFALALEMTNPRFDRERFIKAATANPLEVA